MIPCAWLTLLGWPKVQMGIASLQEFMLVSGPLGVWVYTFLERILIDRPAPLLQRLASELTLAEQRERKRLSDFLHDDLQQILAGVNLWPKA